MIDFARLIGVLVASGVDFIVVEGIAGAVHGAARATYDLDIVYARHPANLDRLAAALSPLNPYLRGAPPGLPFRLDVGDARARPAARATSMRSQSSKPSSKNGIVEPSC